ncbi:MAG: hypothetical protein ABSF24_07750 [Candidatus Bathyarchaeia archaeon]|jgi:hypothetical protein
MVDISEMSTIVAAVGVLIGVVLTVVELRNLVKQRKTDLVTNLYSIYSSEGFQKEWHTFMTEELGSLNTYQDKFGVEFPPSAVFFNEIGILLEKGLIDVNLVNSLFGGVIPRYWKKFKPFLVTCRKEIGQPKLGRGLEYLGNEIQKLQSKEG